MLHTNHSATLRPGIIIISLFLNGCHNHDPQISLKAFEGNSARLPPAGTVPVSVENGFPKIDEQFLADGKNLFEKNCVVCHGWNGRGQGIAVKRGLLPPPDFHGAELREIDPEGIVEIITEGHEGMPSYARRLTSLERWKVAAYIKALQLSQDIPTEMLSEEDREKLP